MQRVKNGQSGSAVPLELGMSTQTRCNWLKAFETHKLNGPVAKVVSAEQMAFCKHLSKAVFKG